MKTTLLALLATTATLSSALPSPSPAADGLYIVTTDSSGAETTTFTAHAEFLSLNNITSIDDLTITARFPSDTPSPGPHALSKRRDGCHTTVSISSSITDRANTLLQQSFPSGNNVDLGGRQKRSYIHDGAKSFVCSYGAGWKPKTSIMGTWDWVKRTRCGKDKLGYGQVQDGVGDWTAGYTFSNDKFCW